MTWDIDAPPGQVAVERPTGRTWRVLGLVCLALALLASGAAITVVVQRLHSPPWTAWAGIAAGLFVASWGFAWLSTRAHPNP